MGYPIALIELMVALSSLEMDFDRENPKRKLAGLATKGIFIGTSSWKYPGWRGMLYDESRYVWRGKFAESRFNKLWKFVISANASFLCPGVVCKRKKAKNRDEIRINRGSPVLRTNIFVAAPRGGSHPLRSETVLPAKANAG